MTNNFQTHTHRHEVKPGTLLSENYPKPLGAFPLYRALEEVFSLASVYMQPRSSDVIPNMVNQNIRQTNFVHQRSSEEFGLPRCKIYMTKYDQLNL